MLTLLGQQKHDSPCKNFLHIYKQEHSENPLLLREMTTDIFNCAVKESRHRGCHCVCQAQEKLLCLLFHHRLRRDFLSPKIPSTCCDARMRHRGTSPTGLLSPSRASLPLPTSTCSQQGSAGLHPAGQWGPWSPSGACPPMVISGKSFFLIVPST